jgi:hypothetical protein
MATLEKETVQDILARKQEEVDAVKKALKHGQRCFMIDGFMYCNFVVRNLKKIEPHSGGYLRFRCYKKLRKKQLAKNKTGVAAPVMSAGNELKKTRNS